MNPNKAIILASVFSVGGTLTGVVPAPAQTFQSYHCADGTQFILAFYRSDPRAYMQIDGKAVTLSRQVALSGSRYSASGITVRIGKTGMTVKHLGRPLTACEPT
jgi:membrane-bound inhibitor of C-type lysozyme